MKLRVYAAAAIGMAALLQTHASFAAPSKGECVDANTMGQNLRRDGKLRSAREKLLVCVQAGCPEVVRDDCAQRLEEVDRATPTIVFQAKDASGADVAAVTVTMDRAPFASRLDGTAIAADAGEHEFVFEMAGQAVTRKLVLREGEKARRELIEIGSAKASAPEAAASLTVLAGAGDDIAIDGKIVGVGRWSEPVPAGTHEVRVSHAGKKTYRTQVDLKGARELEVTLEDERASGLPLWAWIAGGVVVVGGASAGIYFLARPSEERPPSTPVGGFGTVRLSLPAF